MDVDALGSVPTQLDLITNDGHRVGVVRPLQRHGVYIDAILHLLHPFGVVHEPHTAVRVAGVDPHGCTFNCTFRASTICVSQRSSRFSERFSMTS
mgnify:CR=1 FL=1